jgi:TolB-like protein
LKITTLIKIWIVSIACLTGFQAGALAAVRVAVLPFQINADKDYTFLQKGIVDMLTSRLSWADKVEVIDPVSTAHVLESIQGLRGDSLALMAGAKLKADFTLFGSITLVGESVSIDAKMLDVTGTRPPLTFFEQTQGMDSVIPKINRLATDINTTVLGRPAPSVPTVAAAPAPTAAPTPVSPLEDIHANPEKMIQNGHVITEPGQGQAPLSPLAGTAAPQATAGTLNPAFEATLPSGGRGAQSEFWKSRNFKFLINGLDVGDVNHDGLAETVLAAPDQVYIYQFAQGRMREIAKIDTGSNYNIGVDVGDINGNGTPEIYITSLNSRQDVLASQVVEFDGQTFKPIVQDARWYFRIVHDPDRGQILLGQRQRSGGADPLSSPVVELTWQGKDFMEGARVLPAGKANLLGVAYGDLRNDKSETVAGFSAEDKLRLFTASGEMLWTSDDYYGGSPLAFSLPSDNPGGMQRFFFLPIRTRSADLDGDGKNELLTAQNIDSSGRKLGQQRFFNGSRLMALVWDGLGMTPAWQTHKISGRIQDFVAADFDNDGQTELLAAVVSKEGRLIGMDAQSTLIAYDLKTKK